MGVWGWLRRGKGDGGERLSGLARTGGEGRGRRPRRRSFDAAAASTHTDKLWENADGTDLPSLTAASLATLQKRANHEVLNNGWAKGIAATHAECCVGAGPRLQVRSGDDWGRVVEDEFGRWAESCDVEGKLSLGQMVALGDRGFFDRGEILLVLETNPHAGTPVSLGLRMVDPTRLDTPLGLWLDASVQQGIKRDAKGRPVSYYLLRGHPGSTLGLASSAEYDEVPAEQVVHCYLHEQAGQIRGYPWLAPSLTTFAQMRAWTLAVLDAARTAASLSGVIQTTSSEVKPANVSPMDEVDLERNTWLTLPAGWTASQMKPEQPQAGHRDFQRACIAEAARPVQMPASVAELNSADLNYSSGRLDHQAFWRHLATVQNLLAVGVLNKVFRAWLREALLVPGYLPARAARAYTREVSVVAARRGAGDGAAPRWRLEWGRGAAAGMDIPPDELAWYWPRMEHIDQLKEAAAQDRRLRNGMACYADEWDGESKDDERQFVKRAREVRRVLDLAAEYKVPPEAIAPALFPAVKAGAVRDNATAVTE